jgi:hypothetical protein
MRNAWLRAGLRAAGRTRRWKAQTYEQAWLFGAFMAVTVFAIAVIVAAFNNWPQPWPLDAFIVSAGAFAAHGLGSSYDVYRRRR